MATEPFPTHAAACVKGLVCGCACPHGCLQVRRAVHGLVQYVQKAAGLTLRGLVGEFVRDARGDVYFMAPLRADWASLIPGL